MPKLKTNKSAKKRMRFTKSGKIKRSRAFKSHILTKKSRKRKRMLRHSVLLKPTETKIMRQLLPYG